MYKSEFLTKNEPPQEVTYTYFCFGFGAVK